MTLRLSKSNTFSHCSWIPAMTTTNKALQHNDVDNYIYSNNKKGSFKPQYSRLFSLFLWSQNHWRYQLTTFGEFSDLWCKFFLSKRYNWYPQSEHNHVVAALLLEVQFPIKNYIQRSSIFSSVSKEFRERYAKIPTQFTIKCSYLPCMWCNEYLHHHTLIAKVLVRVVAIGY